MNFAYFITLNEPGKPTLYWRRNYHSWFSSSRGNAERYTSKSTANRAAGQVRRHYPKDPLYIAVDYLSIPEGKT